MQSMVITNLGQALITKMIGGTATATFTKVRSSDHDYSSAVLEELTAISDVKQTVDVSSVTITDTSLVEVLARFDNSSLATGYYINTLGLYATDSDLGTEILFGVCIADQNPDYMPAFGGSTVTGESFRLNVRVDDSSAVTIVIDPAAVPSMEQVQDLEAAQQQDASDISDLQDIVGSTDISGIADDTLTGAVKSFYAFMKHIQDNADAHNGIYVEEDITDMWDDGTFSQHVQDGTFKDIFPGMYIRKTYTVSGLNTSLSSAATETVEEDFVVGDLDYHLHHGDTETTDHHALMVMKNGSSLTHKMNTSNVTTGGFVGSGMWTTTIPAFATAMQNLFGSSHILSHKELLSNTVNTSTASMAGAGFTGAATNWEWKAVLFNIMNNAMRFGVCPTSSSFYDTGDCTKQLALFQLANDLKIAHLGKGGARYWDWLRDVASSTYFAHCGNDGHSAYNVASNSFALRGYFLLR